MFCLCASAPLHLCASTPLHLCASTPLRLCTSAPLRLAGQVGATPAPDTGARLRAAPARNRATHHDTTAPPRRQCQRAGAPPAPGPRGPPATSPCWPRKGTASLSTWCLRAVSDRWAQHPLRTLPLPYSGSPLASEENSRDRTTAGHRCRRHSGPSRCHLLSEMKELIWSLTTEGQTEGVRIAKQLQVVALLHTESSVCSWSGGPGGGFKLICVASKVHWAVSSIVTAVKAFTRRQKSHVVYLRARDGTKPVELVQLPGLPGKPHDGIGERVGCYEIDPRPFVHHLEDTVEGSGQLLLSGVPGPEISSASVRDETAGARPRRRSSSLIAFRFRAASAPPSHHWHGSNSLQSPTFHSPWDSRL